MLMKIAHNFGTWKRHKKLSFFRLLAEERRWIELEQKSRNALAKSADRAEILSLLAYSLQQQSKLDEAYEFAAQAVILAPGCWTSNFIAGTALFGLEREMDAIQYFRQAVAIAPNNTQSILQLVRAISAVYGIEHAEAEFREHCLSTGCEQDILVAPVSTVRDWAQRIGLSLLEAGEVEEIPFKEPRVSGMTYSSEITIALSNKPYVANIPNARIFSQSSLILTADGTVLSDTGGDPQFGSIVSFEYEKVVLSQRTDKVLLNFREYKKREIDSGIFMAGLASNAFGHWLPEFLPKLQFLQQHPNFMDFPLIVDENMPENHFEHLKRLTNRPLILLQANESLLCKRLLVAPSPAFFPTELFKNNIPVQKMPGLSVRAMQFLRGNESLRADIVPNRRLFLARKRMKWRRLLNEDSIAINLSKLGFETIFLEEMTARDQISLFQQAEWIVAPNGSALLNLIFADTRVKLVVLTQPNLFNWGTFQGPMDALGYDSVCVPGETDPAQNSKHSDYYISEKKIRHALADMGMIEAIG